MQFVLLSSGKNKSSRFGLPSAASCSQTLDRKATMEWRDIRTTLRSMHQIHPTAGRDGAIVHCEATPCMHVHEQETTGIQAIDHTVRRVV